MEEGGTFGSIFSCFVFFISCKIKAAISCFEGLPVFFEFLSLFFFLSNKIVSYKKFFLLIIFGFLLISLILFSSLAISNSISAFVKSLA